MRFIPTICPYCGAGCGMYMVVQDNRVVGTEPWTRHPVSEGKLCIKGWRAHEFVNHPDRLKSPLLRRNGVLEAVSWEEALDYTASRLAAIARENGPEATGFLSSAKCTNEENYLLQKMARVFGSPNVDHCARL